MGDEEVNNKRSIFLNECSLGQNKGKTKDIKDSQRNLSSLCLVFNPVLEAKCRP